MRILRKMTKILKKEVIDPHLEVDKKWKWSQERPLYA